MSDRTAQNDLQQFIAAKVMRLYHQKSSGVSSATAQLAKLRRGTGEPPLAHPGDSSWRRKTVLKVSPKSTAVRATSRVTRRMLHTLL